MLHHNGTTRAAAHRPSSIESGSVRLSRPLRSLVWVTHAPIGHSASPEGTLPGVRARVYLETTIVSYLVGWLNQHDLYVAAQQECTREWWTNQRQAYELFASAVVVKEARDGNAELAEARLAFLHERLCWKSPMPPITSSRNCFGMQPYRGKRSWMLFTLPSPPSTAWIIC